MPSDDVCQWKALRHRNDNKSDLRLILLTFESTMQQAGGLAAPKGSFLGQIAIAGYFGLSNVNKKAWVMFGLPPERRPGLIEHEKE